MAEDMICRESGHRTPFMSLDCDISQLGTKLLYVALLLNNAMEVSPAVSELSIQLCLEAASPNKLLVAALTV